MKDFVTRITVFMLAVCLSFSCLGDGASANDGSDDPAKISADTTGEEAVTGPDLSMTGAITLEAPVDETDPHLLKYGNVTLLIPADDLLSVFHYGDTVSVDLGKYGVYTVPVYGAYEDAPYGGMMMKANTGYNYVTLAINNGAFALAAGIIRDAEGDAETPYVLQDGVTFPLTVIMSHAGLQSESAGNNLLSKLIRTNNREDYPTLTDAEFANFRAVHTTGIGDGKLYRSSSPICPQYNRNTYADAAAEAAGVKTFINLVDTESEAVSYPGYAESYYQTCRHVFLNMPMAYDSDIFRKRLAEGYRYMITSEAPFLIHCAEGKDRGGIVVAVLECLYGASYEEIVRDYTVTYRNYYSVENGAQRALTEDETEEIARTISNILETIFGVPMTSDTDLSDAAVHYLQGIGLSDDEIAALKDVLKE